MKDKSELRGSNTLPAEVTNVSGHGFWLALEGEELFLSFADFPWFKEATIERLTHVERPHPGHLYWPDLDIDLSVDSIRNPAGFPLVSKRR